MSRSFSFLSKTSTAGVVPETTQLFGELTAAMVTSPSSRGAISDSGTGTASIDPAGKRCIRLRLATTRASALSRVKTSARQAATYSPML